MSIVFSHDENVKRLTVCFLLILEISLWWSTMGETRLHISMSESNHGNWVVLWISFVSPFWTASTSIAFVHKWFSWFASKPPFRLLDLGAPTRRPSVAIDAGRATNYTDDSRVHLIPSTGYGEVSILVCPRPLLSDRQNFVREPWTSFEQCQRSIVGWRQCWVIREDEALGIGLLCLDR